MNSTTEEFAHESEKSTKITSSEWDVGELRGSHAGCVRIKRLVSVIISHGRACRRHIWGIANLWWPLLWWPPEDGGGPCVAPALPSTSFLVLYSTMLYQEMKDFFSASYFLFLVVGGRVTLTLLLSGALRVSEMREPSRGYA